MDVKHFFECRTSFIRMFYTEASQPFSERIRKIEACEPPFSEADCTDDPESGEPAFQLEWAQADELREATGRAAVSMLAASLKLYFSTWEHLLQLRDVVQAPEFRASFKRGFIAGYRAVLESRHVDWSTCTADISLLEQVVRARNRDQHPEEITALGVVHSEADRSQHARLFFQRGDETALDDEDFFVSPRVHISAEKLEKAIRESETLVSWLEEHFLDLRYRERASSTTGVSR